MGFKEISCKPPPWSWVNIDRDENKICSYRAIRIYAGSTKTLMTHVVGWIEMDGLRFKIAFKKTFT
jgi:hypothetical protein